MHLCVWSHSTFCTDNNYSCGIKILLLQWLRTVRREGARKEGGGKKGGSEQVSHREKREGRKGKREGRREQASEEGREQGGGSTLGVLITSESCIILYYMFSLLHITINAS